MIRNKQQRNSMTFPRLFQNNFNFHDFIFLASFNDFSMTFHDKIPLPPCFSMTGGTCSKHTSQCHDVGVLSSLLTVARDTRQSQLQRCPQSLLHGVSAPLHTAGCTCSNKQTHIRHLTRLIMLLFWRAQRNKLVSVLCTNYFLVFWSSAIVCSIPHIF